MQITVNQTQISVNLHANECKKENHRLVLDHICSTMRKISCWCLILKLQLNHTQTMCKLDATYMQNHANKNRLHSAINIEVNCDRLYVVEKFS